MKEETLSASKNENFCKLDLDLEKRKKIKPAKKITPKFIAV